MRPRIYIAGPISKGDLYHNIKQANDACLTLLKKGFAPLCPHWSCYAGGPYKEEPLDDDWRRDFRILAVAEKLPHGTTHSDWLGMDLPWVEVSHAVLRLPGESEGADQEVAHAHKFGIPVCHSISEILMLEFNNG